MERKELNVMEIKKISIKDFVEGYENCATDALKEEYIKDNLQVINYVPFIKKVTLATNLVNATTFEQETYIDVEDNEQTRSTGRIKFNSPSTSLLFNRTLIENYTNLQVETKGFFEEYDLLKSSGILDKLIIPTEYRDSYIPSSEIAELNTIVDMTRQDVINNNYEIHSYISNQVERFGILTGNVLSPIFSAISENIENLDEDKINKLSKLLDKFLKKK